MDDKPLDRSDAGEASAEARATDSHVTSPSGARNSGRSRLARSLQLLPDSRQPAHHARSGGGHARHAWTLAELFG